MEAGLPQPEMKEQDGGMLVTMFKDVYQMYFIFQALMATSFAELGD
jgi:hypothetical protein